MDKEGRIKVDWIVLNSPYIICTSGCWHHLRQVHRECSCPLIDIDILLLTVLGLAFQPWTSGRWIFSENQINIYLFALQNIHLFLLPQINLTWSNRFFVWDYKLAFNRTEDSAFGKLSYCCISVLRRKYRAVILYTSNMLYPSNIQYIKDICEFVCTHTHMKT